MKTSDYVGSVVYNERIDCLMQLRYLKLEGFYMIFDSQYFKWFENLVTSYSDLRTLKKTNGHNTQPIRFNSEVQELNL